MAEWQVFAVLAWGCTSCGTRTYDQPEPNERCPGCEEERAA